MSDTLRPTLLAGSASEFQEAFPVFQGQPVDQCLSAPRDWTPPEFSRTLAAPAEVSGPATYNRGKTRALRFLPLPAEQGDGWLFDRVDLPEQLPVSAILANVSQADRAIILRAGMASNRVRMSEHIICHRLGLGIDHLRVELSSEDPPLFDQGSLPIVQALDAAGIAEDPRRPIRYVAPRDPVAIMRPGTNGFLLWEPPVSKTDARRFFLDVAIDFPTAIGRQRIQLELCPENFRQGAIARTNCSTSEMRKLRLFGWLLPQYRGMGYTNQNILLAGKTRYANAPQLCLPSGKSLEAVWHRTCLDLVAALSLLPPGTRPAGKLTSFKSGHVLDVRFLTLLLCKDFLAPLPHA